MNTCQGCGIQKNLSALELYPYPEEDCICDDPVSPLFQLTCQPGGAFTGFRKEPWKQVTVCHECFHKLSPDMWISEECWVKLNPVVSFKDLDAQD